MPRRDPVHGFRCPETLAHTREQVLGFDDITVESLRCVVARQSSILFQLVTQSVEPCQAKTVACSFSVRRAFQARWHVASHGNDLYGAVPSLDLGRSSGAVGGHNSLAGK